MENEIRYYLHSIQECMKPDEDGNDENSFKPTHLITAVKLPTGAVEIAINTENIAEKIAYILDTYDEEMHHKMDSNVTMTNLMVV